MKKKTLVLINQEVNQPITEDSDYYELSKPKKYETILTQSGSSEHTNLPKVIPAMYKVKKPQVVQVETKKKKKSDSPSTKEKTLVVSASNDSEGLSKIKTTETKEEKHLRKKLVKEEKKANRLKKKVLKQAFTVNLSKFRMKSRSK